MNAFGKRGSLAAGQRSSFGVAKPMKGSPGSGSAAPDGGEQFPPVEELEPVVEGEPSEPHIPGGAMDRLTARQNASTTVVIRGERRIMDRLMLEVCMSQDYAEIEKSARLLTPEERARLAEALTESLREEMSSEIEAAWEAEIKRRVEAYERGEANLIPAEDVFAKARKIAGE